MTEKLWIKLFRRNSHAFEMLPLGAKGLFGELLKIVDDNGEQGLTVAGVSGLARRFREPIRKVQRWLDLLIEIGAVCLEGQLLRVVNYSRYQSRPKTERHSNVSRTADPCPKHEDNPLNFGPQNPQRRGEERRIRKEEEEKPTAAAQPVPFRVVREGPSREAVQTVYESWTKLAQAMSTMTPPALDRGTSRVIERALRTHTPQDLEEAFRGANLSPWHMANGYWQVKHLLKDVGTITDHRDRWFKRQRAVAR